MSEFNDGDPAFPAQHEGTTRGDASGMTLRDYFAAHSVQAIIAAYIEANGRCIGTEHFVANVAAHAYRMADAMIKARGAA